jgi:nucleoside-diphosphate-sugar epimerase
MRNNTALVIGATGGIGGEVALALIAHGWQVRALTRDIASAKRRAPDFAVSWVQGDAMDRASVVTAAQGAALIVHAANPPGYRDWDRLVVPMLDNTIAAARAAGARILFPGTIYNYGPDAFPVLREESPQNPASRKGALRVAMEQRLKQAASEGVPVTIVRAGDFFGGHAGNNWFAQAMVKPGKPLAVIADIGTPGVGHAWAYLPDLAETMVRLIERSAPALFGRFHFRGFWDADGTEMIAAIRRAAGRPSLRVRRFPWALVVLASPFVRLFKEMREMRYLWREPLQLDNTRLVAALGSEPRTPIDVAVRRGLESLGCLEARPAATESATAQPALSGR